MEHKIYSTLKSCGKGGEGKEAGGCLGRSCPSQHGHSKGCTARPGGMRVLSEKAANPCTPARPWKQFPLLAPLCPAARWVWASCSGSGRIFQPPCPRWLPRQQLEPRSESTAWGWVQVADLLCFPGRGKNKALLLCSFPHLKGFSAFGYRAPNPPSGLDHQR